MKCVVNQVYRKPSPPFLCSTFFMKYTNWINGLGKRPKGDRFMVRSLELTVLQTGRCSNICGPVRYCDW